MAMNINIKPLNYRHKWFTNTITDPEKIIEDAILSIFDSYNPTYEDYIGIYHQIMAIELGYTN